MGEDETVNQASQPIAKEAKPGNAASAPQAEGEPIDGGKASAAKDAMESDTEDYGYIELADEVISIIASLASCEVPGVVGMSTGFREGISKLLGKNNLAKGVRVKVTGKSVRVFVYVTVEYGICIPEIALKIQEKVKESIELMTTYEVEYVDVHIEGVERRKKSDLEISFSNVEENVKETMFNKE